MTAQRIVLAGGSGFIGQMLAARLAAGGYQPLVLTRTADRPLKHGTPLAWDGATLGNWADSFEDALAIVNLTGKSINCRPTAANRRALVESRVGAVRVVAEAIRRCQRPPRVLVQASAVGYYGGTGEGICDETTPPGNDFMAQTCLAWERALSESPLPGVRIVVLRLGVVLGRGGGALDTLAGLARSFLGGTVGSGRQSISWIHEADLAEVFCQAIAKDEMAGAVNAVAPNPVTNAEFMRQLRGAAHRPWSPPVPALAVRLGAWILGTNPDLALEGRSCVPARLLAEGFVFRFPALGEALRDLL